MGVLEGEWRRGSFSLTTSLPELNLKKENEKTEEVEKRRN